MQCGGHQTLSFRGAKVLVTGLSRSGSTWQYNAVKKILEETVLVAREVGVLEPGDWEVRSAHADADSEQFDKCLEARVCVLKTHIFVPRLLLRVDVVLSSHRDVRDVVLSSMLMFGACYAPTGETRTQRAHGVTVRFQHYAHWSPYVCYDMTYEVMMANRTAEVGRLARAALQGNPLASKIDSGRVVEAVRELSSRRPERCVASFKRTGRGAPRECWDKRSGFAASHVHESTSKPMAWSRRAVLDEVQRRVPKCDVFVAMRRVLEGFGGWLDARGYAIEAPFQTASNVYVEQVNFSLTEEFDPQLNATEQDEEDSEEDAPSWLKTAGSVKLVATSNQGKSTTSADTSATGDASTTALTRSRRHLLSVGSYPFDDDDDDEESKDIALNGVPSNSFVESLPEAAYAMDPEMRLARGGVPALYPRFVHVVNPFARKGPHPKSTIGGKQINEDEIVHASLARAWKLACWYGVDVELVASLRVGDRNFDELSSRWPTRRACVSTNGIDTKNGMRLPLLRDLLACADENDSGAHFVILSNPDILVHHHFYLRLYQLVLDERMPFRTAWSITRRQIAPKNFADIAEVLATAGEPHLGHDTFVFPREWLRKLDAATLVPGFSPWGGAFLVMLAHLGRAVVLGDKRWTFHLAADGPATTHLQSEASSNRTAAIYQQLLLKRSEVCENAPGTLYNARASAAALAATLDESTHSRCCCALDDHSAPHATTKMPGPKESHVLDMLSGSRRPPVKPLGLQSYEYLWDRLGPDMTLSRCAALPGIQLLPVEDLKGVVRDWCRKQRYACPGTEANPMRPRTTDCARKDVRPTFENELADDIKSRGAPMTALVVYEKLPTPYEGGHVRLRQLLTWLCHQGHRVLLVHRDVKTHIGRTRKHPNRTKLDDSFRPIGADVGVPGCTNENFAVFGVDESMRAMTAQELARQRVDVAFVTVWFYRVEANPIPAIVLPILSKLSRLRQRKIYIALVSDDVQYERALAVGKSRGDDPDYWRKVRRYEMQFYSDPIVDVIFAISDDDKRAFAELQRLTYNTKGGPSLQPAAERKGTLMARRRRLLSSVHRPDENATRNVEVRKLRSGATTTPPKIAVLPYLARIDGATTRHGWDAHARSAAQRRDLVFVGGSTFSNRVAVRWLLRAALPAVAALTDARGGCAELRQARLVLVGAAAWADEAKKACTEAMHQNKISLIGLLCDSDSTSRTDTKRFGKWNASGVSALGRVDDVGDILRRAKLFVAPAVVASGISTKVWLAVEHGLPVATSFDGTRGLPKDVRKKAARHLPPWILIGSAPRRNHSYTARNILSRESAAKFARDTARVYCHNDTWQQHALSSLTLVSPFILISMTLSISQAKQLESREPWSGGQSK